MSFTGMDSTVIHDTLTAGDQKRGSIDESYNSQSR